MASTYTNLGLELMATGENAGTWGTKTNANLNLVEQLTGGFKIQTLNAAGTGANTTALAVDDGALTGAAQNRIIILGAVSPEAITGNKIVTVPLLTETFYIIKNSTSGAYTVQLKAVSGSGATVTWSATDKGYKLVYIDGVATNTGVIEATLGLQEVAADSITTAMIQDSAVTTAKIADSNVTVAKMAANSVDSDQYVDGSIDTAHIADDQITSAKLGTGDMTFPNGNLVFGTAGKGVYLGVDSATGANLLDDYEEGSWTPVITFGDGATGVGYSTGWQGGRYTKVGNIVHVTTYIILSSKGSSTGNIKITGLPFTNRNAVANTACGALFIYNVSFANQAFLTMPRNQTYVEFRESTEAGTTSYLDNGNTADDSHFNFQITYEV